MPTKKPSAKQLAARAKFVKMVRAKAAKSKAAKKKTVGKIVKKKTVKKAAKKKTIKQTGGSNLLYDKRFQALKPGKRISKKGNKYTEKRANHSDKGRLLGIGDISLDVIGLELYRLEAKIVKLKEQKKLLKTIKEKKELQYNITILTKQYKSLRLYLNTKARFV